jgi:predicted transcriptional regulator
MADFKPRPGTFLPYLEASERRNSPVPSDAPASPLSLLAILARQSKQSLPLFDLQTLSGMQPSRYAEALKSLKDAGFITIEGEAPEQTVQLTASGAQVVQLARPA